MSEETENKQPESKPKIEKIKTCEYPFDKVIGLCKVNTANGSRIEKKEIVDLRLLKQMLCFIQENEGKDCTSVEMVFVDLGDEGSNKLIGFRTKSQTENNSHEMYLVCPIYGHHVDNTGLVKRFKDVSRKLYVQLPMYEETIKLKKEKTRFDMIAEVLDGEVQGKELGENV